MSDHAKYINSAAVYDNGTAIKFSRESTYDTILEDNYITIQNIGIAPARPNPPQPLERGYRTQQVQIITTSPSNTSSWQKGCFQNKWKIAAVTVLVFVLLALLVAGIIIAWLVTSSHVKSDNAQVQTTTTETTTIPTSSRATPTALQTTTTERTTIPTSSRVTPTAYLAPDIYLLEQSSSGGFVTIVRQDGSQTRIPSGGVWEQALAFDRSSLQIFYSTCGVVMNVPDARYIWKANIGDIGGSKTIIWTNTTYCPFGLAVSSLYRKLFAMVFGAGVYMIDYYGNSLDTLPVVQKADSYGAAVDETTSRLYFTDAQYQLLYVVPFNSTKFLGAASVLMQVDNLPAGLVLEGGMLYWIVEPTGEILSAPVDGSAAPKTLVDAVTTGSYYSTYLAKQGSYFYYTKWSSGIGVYRVTMNGTREKIASTLLGPRGLFLY